MSQDTPPASENSSSGIKLAPKSAIPTRPAAVPPPPASGTRPALQRPPVPAGRINPPAVRESEDAPASVSAVGAAIDVVVLLVSAAACIMMALEFLAKNVK